MLLHGFTQSGRSWDPVSDQLLARGFSVQTVDAPGHGGSGSIRANLWTSADLLAETISTRTRSSPADAPPLVVGYSMGGRLALHLALAHPAVVGRLLLLGATPGIDDAAERVSRRLADEALADAIEAEGDDGLGAFIERWLANPLFSTLSRAQAGIEERLHNTAAGLASSLRLTGTGAQQSLWPRLGELAMPVLLAAGALDHKFRSVAADMLPRIRGARTALVADAGHAAHLERPSAFAQLAEQFVSGIPDEE